MQKEAPPLGRSAFGHVGRGRKNPAEDDEARHAALRLRLFRGRLLELFRDGEVVLRAKEREKEKRGGEGEIPERRDGEGRKERGRDRTRDDPHVVARVNDVHRRLLPAAFDFDPRDVHGDVEEPEAEPHEGRGDGQEHDPVRKARHEKSEKEDDGPRHADGLDAEAPNEGRGTREPHDRSGAEREEDESELVGGGARLLLERRNARGEEPVGEARGGKEEESGEARLSVGEGLHTIRTKRKDLHCSVFGENSLPRRDRRERAAGPSRCIMRIPPKKNGKSRHGRFGRI